LDWEKEDVMAWNHLNRTLNRLSTRALANTLVAAGGASVAVLACVQTAEWAMTTLRTRMLTAVTLAFMSALVAAQAPSASGDSTQRTVNAQIVKVSDAYTRAILAGDARGLAALFTVDGYLLPPHVPAAKGQAAIQQGYETLFRGPVKITEFALSHTEATIQGDLAYSVGTYTQRMSLPDGKTVSDTGKHIAILKRIQGEWKLTYLTYNSDLASMPCSSSK
jgi:uncharacterized protein (TIGR02246 family)